jgi:hypothetical protein
MDETPNTEYVPPRIITRKLHLSDSKKGSRSSRPSSIFRCFDYQQEKRKIQIESDCRLQHCRNKWYLCVPVKTTRRKRCVPVIPV